MSLKNTILSARSQAQRNHIVWFRLYEIFRIGKSRSRTQIWLPGMGGERKWRNCFLDTQSPYGAMKALN